MYSQLEKCDYKGHSINGSVLQIDKFRLVINIIKMLQCNFLKVQGINYGLACVFLRLNK